MKRYFKIISFSIIFILPACSGVNNKDSKIKDANKKMNDYTASFITLDPGHFHAALVQKAMYSDVSPVVHVYAPEGPEVNAYLDLINRFNTRRKNPTNWNEIVYRGDDFLEKMLSDKKGNVVVVAGNNEMKTEYIYKSVNAGLNVLADKPMVISPEKFPLLEEAFRIANEKNVLLYDIMTERYEITTILQRELSQMPDVFGKLQNGTPDNPAIIQESVHRFSKIVAGKPLIRPYWFFDINKEGEGIVDVATHLVDLVQWEAFPGKTINKDNILINDAKHWTTDLSLTQFSKVTGLNEFPVSLNKYIENGILKVYSNGEITYKINDIWAKVSVTWNFDKPKGGDTHYSLMRGTKCNLVIKQQAEQQFKPTLYIEPVAGQDFETFENNLKQTIDNNLNKSYPGIKLVKLSGNRFTIDIPGKYKAGHEAHFRQVTENFLKYLETGKLPEWEIPNMITKYYITTTALKIAREKD